MEKQPPGRKGGQWVLGREGKQLALDFHYFPATMGSELSQVFPLTAQSTYSAMIQSH